MSTEDGLSGIKCIAIDAFWWLLIGCKDGIVHFLELSTFQKYNPKRTMFTETKNKGNDRQFGN